MDYFDEEHMFKIEYFMKAYDKINNNDVQPDLNSEICNVKITEEEIITHIKKLNLKKKSDISGEWLIE